MEIFQDGELEEEMRKRDYQAHNLSAIWQLFNTSYQEAIKSLTCPVRANYSITELGPTQFVVDSSSCAPPENDHKKIVLHSANGSIQIRREDFQLENPRGEVLECSFWSAIQSNHDDHWSTATKRATGTTGTSPSPPPCIVYLHGMSSSRKECVYLRDQVLASGFSLLTLDLSGSGLSEGDRVSFGHFEKDDLRTVLDFLFATNKASRVGLWGRCIGGATALLYLCDSLELAYKRIRVPKKDAQKFHIVRCKATGQLMCARPSRVFSFRVTQLSAQNGDFVILSINNRSVKGLDVATCKRLLMENTSYTVEIAGYERRSSDPGSGTGTGGGTGGSGGLATTPPAICSPELQTTTSSSFVFALALDSTFGDMERVIADMLMEVGKSAEKRNVSFPATMVSAASKIISRSVRKTAGFHFRDIAVLGSVSELTLPCHFVSASKVDFIRPEHTRAIFDHYGGNKQWVSFDGAHDQNRPEYIVESICDHFVSQWKETK